MDLRSNTKFDAGRKGNQDFMVEIWGFGVELGISRQNQGLVQRDKVWALYPSESHIHSHTSHWSNDLEKQTHALNNIKLSLNKIEDLQEYIRTFYVHHIQTK